MRKTLFLAVLLLIAAGMYAYSEDVGNYRIPGPVTYAGTTVETGTYTISIVEGEGGPWLQLSKGGQVVAKDLAIMIPAKSPGKTSVQVAKIAGQEFVRIRVRHGDNWYYAYLVKE